jgi:hypothetical protein
MYKRPYYFIHNENRITSGTTKNNIPTNPYTASTTGTGLGTGTD